MRLLSADYNQVELRVLAHVAGEDVLREIFASGEDVHAATAAEVLGDLARRGRPGASGRRPRWSTSGSPTGSPLSASPTGCRSRARRRPRTSSATSSASRPSRLHRRDDRQGRARRVRLHAAGPPPGDPRAPLPAAPAPVAGRAAGGQHRHPGHGGGHHQARDGALPLRRWPRQASRPGWCSRSTTSSSSRGRAAEMDAAAELVRRRDVRRLRARPAAGGRRRHRRRLAGREVRGAAPRRPSDVPGSTRSPTRPAQRQSSSGGGSLADVDAPVAARAMHRCRSVPDTAAARSRPAAARSRPAAAPWPLIPAAARS